MRSSFNRARLPSSSSRNRSGRQFTPLIGPVRSNPPFVAMTRSGGYGYKAPRSAPHSPSAIRLRRIDEIHPSSTAARNTPAPPCDRAAVPNALAGNAHRAIPEPVTLRSPSMEKVPLCDAFVMGEGPCSKGSVRMEQGVRSSP